MSNSTNKIEKIDFLGNIPSLEKLESISNLSQKLIDRYRDVPEEMELYNSLIEIKENFDYLKEKIYPDAFKE